MKAAAFSQADILEIISASIENPNFFQKFSVSLPSVMATKVYSATQLDIDEADEKLIGEYLTEGYGTIVRLKEVRKINHPSVKDTFNDLRTKLGVIYFYFLSVNKIKVKIGDYSIDAIDPLFVAEADGNLDENLWDGQSVKWIEKERKLLLDTETGASCIISATQLPYPPIFNIIKESGASEVNAAEIRQRYLIGAGNYGFYVYRNHRLISWASSLQGIVPQDQDYYAFRGRILISDEADDYFNIDVKKSNIILSDDAWRAISDYTEAGRYKSRKAWQNAGSNFNKIVSKRI
ncbi:MAG: hypothetical protein WKG07_22815 [Hymenobacter sp.]